MQEAQGDTTSSILVGYKSTGWRYLDSYACNAATGATGPAGWAARAFTPTSSWRTGSTPIGYGNAGLTTISGQYDLDPLVRGVQRPPTSYFRKSFTLASTAGIVAGDLSLIRDDGAVVYLNGVEGGCMCALLPGCGSWEVGLGLWASERGGGGGSGGGDRGVCSVARREALPPCLRGRVCRVVPSSSSLLSEVYLLLRYEVAVCSSFMAAAPPPFFVRFPVRACVQCTVATCPLAP